MSTGPSCHCTRGQRWRSAWSWCIERGRLGSRGGSNAWGQNHSWLRAGQEQQTETLIQLYYGKGKEKEKGVGEEDVTPQHQKGNVGPEGDRKGQENKVELEIWEDHLSSAIFCRTKPQKMVTKRQELSWKTWTRLGLGLKNPQFFLYFREFTGRGKQWPSLSLLRYVSSPVPSQAAPNITVSWCNLIQLSIKRAIWIAVFHFIPLLG